MISNTTMRMWRSLLIGTTVFDKLALMRSWYDPGVSCEQGKALCERESESSCSVEPLEQTKGHAVSALPFPGAWRDSSPAEHGAFHPNDTRRPCSRLRHVFLRVLPTFNPLSNHRQRADNSKAMAVSIVHAVARVCKGLTRGNAGHVTAARLLNSWIRTKHWDKPVLEGFRREKWRGKVVNESGTESRLKWGETNVGGG